MLQASQGRSARHRGQLVDRLVVDMDKVLGDVLTEEVGTWTVVSSFRDFCFLRPCNEE